MFDNIKFPFMENDDGANGGEVADTTTENVSTEIGANSGEPVQTEETIPDGNKPSAEWAEMRRKAQEADKLRARIEELEKNNSSKDLEAKIKKLEKGLPDGFTNIDDYLEFLDGNDSSNEPEVKPEFDENKVKSLVENIVEKRLNEHPATQKASQYVKREEKRMEDEFVVKNFQELKDEFPEIQKAEDIPYEILESFMKNEVDSKNYKRSLLSYYVEKNYKSIIEKAKKQGEGTAIAKDKSISHTSKVQGSNEATEYDNIEVPDEIRAQLNRAGITDRKKQNYYYKKHHRTE